MIILKSIMRRKTDRQKERREREKETDRKKRDTEERETILSTLDKIRDKHIGIAHRHILNT